MNICDIITGKAWSHFVLSPDNKVLDNVMMTKSQPGRDERVAKTADSNEWN